VGEFIELNKEMFDLLHQAGQVKECKYSVTYSDGFPFVEEECRGSKKAAQSLCLEAVYYAEVNQPKKMFEALKDGLCLIDSLTQNNTLIHRILQLGITSLYVNTLSRGLNHTTLSESQLLELQEQLRECNERLSFGTTMPGEICLAIEYRKKFEAVSFVPTFRIIFLRAIGMFEKNLIKTIEIEQFFMAIEKYPIGDQFLQCKKLRKELEELPFFYSLTKRSLLPMIPCFKIHLRIKSDVYNAITALAIERFRIKENRLPQTLDELVPEYLKEVYIDPFDGKSLKYKWAESGYMVYSIGMDCVDDGGKSRDKNISKDHTCDEVFRIYH
jgi:hypothetical protein